MRTSHLPSRAIKPTRPFSDSWRVACTPKRKKEDDERDEDEVIPFNFDGHGLQVENCPVLVVR